MGCGYLCRSGSREKLWQALWKIDPQVKMYNIEEYADVANVCSQIFGGQDEKVGWKSSFDLQVQAEVSERL